MPKAITCDFCEKRIKPDSRKLKVGEQKQCTTCYWKTWQKSSAPSSNHNNEYKRKGANDEDDETTSKKVKLSYPRYAFSKGR